jgi:nitrite reductase/ring-hydroxylating ferredoxin subunit
MVPGSHRPILIVSDQSRVCAFDNRRPHTGFPLDRGSVEDGILTCHWSHARFDLASGCTFDLSADDAPTCPVEARGGEVWVKAEFGPWDPPLIGAKGLKPAWLTILRSRSRFKSPGSSQHFLFARAASTTLSTFNAISYPAARSVSSERKRSGHGEPRLQPEREGLLISRPQKYLPVTKPSGRIILPRMGKGAMNRLQATESTSCKGTAVNAEKENPCPQTVDKRRFARTQGALES